MFNKAMLLAANSSPYPGYTRALLYIARSISYEYAN